MATAVFPTAVGPPMTTSVFLRDERGITWQNKDKFNVFVSAAGIRNVAQRRKPAPRIIQYNGCGNRSQRPMSLKDFI